MRQQIVWLIAAVVFPLMSVPGVTAQESTPQGVRQEATPAIDWLAEWALGQTATINGAEIYFEDHGDPAGQPVLPLHSGLENTEEFINLTPVLVAAGYRMIAMDCRGHGRSSWGDVPITYEQMAADAIGLLDELGIEKTDVVGWSDGADISLDLTIHHPESLNRVVAYGANFTTAGVRDNSSDQTPLFERYMMDYRRLSPEPERFNELVALLETLYTIEPNYSEAELPSIPLPVLILDGADDEDITPDQPQRMAALIPDATLVIMPGTGHFAPFAMPTLFSQIVLDYLDGKPMVLAATPGVETLSP